MTISMEERDAFEYWADRDHRDITPQEYEDRDPKNGHYYSQETTNEAYRGWMARAALAALPAHPSTATELAREWRMDAYYYRFTQTGNPHIDRILSAVACAGKAFHHTDSWNDESKAEWYGDHLRGDSPTKWIQNAADDAAAALAAKPAK